MILLTHERFWKVEQSVGKHLQDARQDSGREALSRSAQCARRCFQGNPKVPPQY
jgi:hypothetical protein